MSEVQYTFSLASIERANIWADMRLPIFFVCLATQKIPLALVAQFTLALVRIASRIGV